MQMSMTNRDKLNNVASLGHFEIDLEGILRLSHQEFDSGDRLTFEKGVVIPAKDIVEHETVLLSTSGLSLNVKRRLEEYGANSYSVQPYIDLMPSQIEVTIYTIKGDFFSHYDK